MIFLGDSQEVGVRFNSRSKPPLAGTQTLQNNNNSSSLIYKDEEDEGMLVQKENNRAINGIKGFYNKIHEEIA
jgi:hypothetical protein